MNSISLSDGHATATAFERQLQQHHSAERPEGAPTVREITEMPFKIQMEVRGDATKLSRVLAPLRWNASLASSD